MTSFQQQAARFRPSLVQLYFTLVVGCGSMLLHHSVAGAAFAQPLLLVSLAVGSVLVSAPFLRVTIPLERNESTMSLAYTIDLVAITLLGPAEASLVALAGTWSQCHFATRGRTPWHRTIFSLAAVAISVQGAGAAYIASGGAVGSTSPAAVFTPLLAATVVLYALNSGLVAAAISVARVQPLWRVWQANFMWSAPGYFAGAAIALAAITIIGAVGFWPLPLLAAPLYLTMKSYQVYLGRLSSDQQRLEAEQQQVRQLSDMHLATVEALARAIEAKEQSPHSHIRRIQACATALAKAAGMTEAEIAGVATAALLHDIGKLGIPEYILTRTGPLSPSEMQRVRQHPELGAAIVADVPFPYPVTPLILSHHERWDGTGYPQGLSGDRIPKGARVLAVADYFDALTSDRCYRERFRWDEAVAIIRHEAGRALDPALVDCFINLLPSLPRDADTADESRLQGSTTPNRVQAVFSNIAQAHQEVRALNEISKAVTSSLRLDDVMSAFAPRLAPLVPFASCALFLPDESADVLRCHFASGFEADALRGAILRRTDPVFHRVLHTQRPEGNAPVNSLFERSQRMSEVFASCTLAPLSVVDRAIGVLALFHTEPMSFHEDHLRLLERVCEHTAPAIQNAVLFERTRENSLTDALTGLPNARSLLVRVLSELSRAEQDRSALTLLLVDVDHFKQINDTHGHRAGDRALCGVARAIESVLGPADFAARYAGDEFVLLLSGASDDEVHSRLSELDAAMRAVRFETTAEQALSSVGVSVGAASYGRDGVTLEALLSAADRRMYTHKARREPGERRIVSTVSTPHRVVDFRGAARVAGHQGSESSVAPEAL